MAVKPVKQEAWISTGRWVRRSTTRGGDTGVVRGGAGGESDGGEREAAAAAKAAATATAKAAAAEDRAKKRAAPANKTAKDGRCEHGRERRFCKDCGSSGLCEQHAGGGATVASTAAAAASASTGAGAQRVQGVLPDSLLWLVFNLLFPKMSTYTHTKSARINSHVTAAEESALAVFFGQKN